MSARHRESDGIEAIALPPHSIEAEQSLLGAVMLDNRVLDRINGSLRGDHFYSSAHRLIFEREQALHGEGQPIDVTTLRAAFEADGQLDRIGGFAYLGTLIDNVPTAAHAEHYAGIVRERARLRSLMAISVDMKNSAAARGAPDSRTLLLEFQAKLDALARDEHAPGFEALDLEAMASEPVAERRFRVGQIMPMGLPGLFTGHGGAGKTQLGLHLACCIAVGRPFFGESVASAVVAYVSTEDDRTDLHYRLAQQTGVLGVTLDELVGRLFLYDLTSSDSVLITATSTSDVVPTAQYAALRADLRRRGVDVVFLDNFANLCAVDLIRPAHATRAIALCGELVPADGNAILIAHVDKATARAGHSREAYSETAAFHNRSRWRWFLFAPNRDADVADGEEIAAADPHRILEVQKLNAGRVGTRIPLRILDNGAIGSDGPGDGIIGSITRRRERGDVLASVGEAEARGIPIPTAETNRYTAYEVLVTMPSYPEALHGRAGKRRLFHLLRQMRTDGELDVCEFTGSGRNRRQGYRVARIEK